jgi:uncharacterized protein YkwD
MPVDERKARLRNTSDILRIARVISFLGIALCIYANSASARQLPERFEYHPLDSLQRPSGVAARLALDVSTILGKTPVLDRTLIESAERLVTNPKLTARDAMRASGASDAFALPLRYRTALEPTLKPVLHMLRTEVKNARVSHFGIAVRQDNDGFYVALLFVRRGASIGRFPTHFELGQQYVIDGRLASGLDEPRLLIASPDAAVREFKPRHSHGIFWTHISFNRGPGRYILEVQAKDEFGVQVLNLMEIYASEPGTPRQVPIVRLRPPESLPATAEVAASRAIKLVNRSRRNHHLPPLRLSNALAREAEKHAADMAMSGFFGHESPHRGGLAKRLGKTRLTLALENIAIGLSPDTVHAELLRSPSHLRNILDPGVTHIGIGAYRRTVGDSQPVYTFSQIFGRFH